jgi:eukaryotic-like serine/threonine-protein kinase
MVALGWLCPAVVMVIASASPPARSLGWPGRGSVQGETEGHPWPMVGGDAAHSGSTEGPAPPYREAWSVSDLSPLAGPVVAGDTVILVDADRVVAVERETGAPVWETDRAAGPAGPAALAGNLVIFAEGRGGDAAISAARLQDGEAVWSVPMRAPAFGGPAVDNGRVYVGTSDGRVFALAADEGTRVWEYRATGRVDTSPAVADGLVYVAAEDFTSGAATVYALDADAGRERWRFSPSGPGLGVSSVSVAEETAFVGLGDFMVHAFDAATGAQRWSTRARAPFSSRLAPSAASEVILGDRAGHLYGLEPGSGERAWIFRVPGDLVDASPVVAGGAAVVGDGGGQASAIDLRSGLLVWKRILGAGPVGAIASDGERLYLAVQGGRGRLVALEHDPGAELLAEPSPTTLFVWRALLNFGVAALALGGGLFLLFSRLGRERKESAPSTRLDDRPKGEET